MFLINELTPKQFPVKGVLQLQCFFFFLLFSFFELVCKILPFILGLKISMEALQRRCPRCMAIYIAVVAVDSEAAHLDTYTSFYRFCDSFSSLPICQNNSQCFWFHPPRGKRADLVFQHHASVCRKPFLFLN